MIAEDVYNILGYLKKHKSANTFRLARELSIDRYRILNLINSLETKGAIEVKSGTVRFIKFPGKKVIEPKVTEHVKVKKDKVEPKREATKSRASTEILDALGDLQAENKILKERLLELEVGIKIQSSFNNKLRIQAEHIENLEEVIRELQSKTQTPKITKRTMVKTMIKEAPIKKEKSAKLIRFKVPKFDISWVKNIQQFKMPKFIGQKIVSGEFKINLVGLNKNIQRLHVPEMLKIH
ncbi:MAG: hypothetical protein AABY14_02645 [Nanoarchaeota archaeon]